MTREIELRLPLRDDSDVDAARRAVTRLAERRCMPRLSVEELATAVSEIARNVIEHAGEGELLAGTLRAGERVAIVVIAEDSGGGIADVAHALEDGYSTGNGLGLGLSSARRFVDDFEIRSEPTRGTTVTLTKWIASANGVDA